MQYQCIVSYRTARSKTISIWRTSLRGADLLTVASAAITNLKKRQRQRLTVLGIYVRVREA